MLEAYQPQILVTQHGCDTHRLDPLAHLTCSVDGQRATYRRLAELAGSHAGGRWVALGGGGYEVGQVVPRAWTHLLAELTGAAVNGATPDSWRQQVIVSASVVRRPTASPIWMPRPPRRRAVDRLDGHGARRVGDGYPPDGLPAAWFDALAMAAKSRASKRPADVRRTLLEYALTLPEAWEDHPWGDSVVKVRKKIFLFLGVRSRRAAVD